MRVLFLESDALTAETRVVPLLEALRVAGRIHGFACVDRGMAITDGGFDRYDVALTHRNPSARQVAWLRRYSLPFVYDVDDLLLSAPNQPLSARRRAERAGIIWCLSRAGRITSPTSRLLSVLAERAQVGLKGRAVMLPNTGLEHPPPPKSGVRPRLLWVSSDVLRFSAQELEGVRTGIAAAVADHKLDCLLLGRFPDAVRNALGRPEHRAWMPHALYRQCLAEGNFIAVAPLATDLPAAEQCALDCKSDVKAAEFGSSRIAAAYSAAPPYAESDLPCELVAVNSAGQWRDAVGRLVETFPHAGNRLGDHPAFALRRPSAVALRLLECLEAARAGASPVRYRALATPRFIRHFRPQPASAAGARVAGAAVESDQLD
jgi:hypothetical protein